ncbi:MAG: MMPL family transporter [Candidatus Anammoximicrobium sp.]|nr:MMPL family transporter [Candidatus Anammoximicrobium sp.]
MFLFLGKLVTRHWLAVIVGWVLIVALLQWAAPNWDDVTRDGDLAFLPPQMPSVRGERLLSDAFPRDRAKSEIAVFVGRDEGALQGDELAVAYDLARQFKNLHGVAAMSRAQQQTEEAEQLRQKGQAEAAGEASRYAEKLWTQAESALDEAVRLDGLLQDYWQKKEEAAQKKSLPPDTVRRQKRLAAAFHNRSLIYARQGKTKEAASDAQVARDLDATFRDRGPLPFPEQAMRLPLLGVWTWQDEVFGEKLRKPEVRVMLLNLSNEFMAVDNIALLDYLETVLDGARETLLGDSREHVKIGFSGSAAVGGDLLRAAADSIENTELFTVLLVILILSFVYRSPLLVIMPMATIFVSLTAATSIVAMLAQLAQQPYMDWWDFKIFTTTKVFIIVILYGSGTDFFLFLVARYREELERGRSASESLSESLGAVGTALTASALTTILGLGTMYFAEFGKFKYSGPAIGLCLVVTLAACMTLAPALLRAFGMAAFWPFGQPRLRASSSDGTEHGGLEEPGGSRRWRYIAAATVARPGLILTLSLLVLMIPAFYGVRHGEEMTYDFLRQLPRQRPSRQGAEFMQRHFSVGESGPLTVLAYQSDAAFDTKEGRQQISELGRELYVPGVTAVRSVADPLGKFPPGRRLSLFDRNSWLKMVAAPHPETQNIYVASEGDFAGRATRLDLILEHDPFSLEAEQTVDAVERKLQEIQANPESPWHAAAFVFSGTPADLRDLKRVTKSDNRRIQILVVLAVLGVLLLILRRPVVCLYMIVTVVFSYYVTIGVTHWLFAWLDGADFLGLDWRVPLYLFVILVAIGEDYNIYLVTRVQEEQARLGPLPGLQHAVIWTGGIITSCGLIMAGSFVSMTSGVWGPAVSAWVPAAGLLLGTGDSALSLIVQLGFALSFGVLLDTFVVRTVLLPAFLALLCRWAEKRSQSEPPGPPAPHRKPAAASVNETLPN